MESWQTRLHKPTASLQRFPPGNENSNSNTAMTLRSSNTSSNGSSNLNVEEMPSSPGGSNNTRRPLLYSNSYQEKQQETHYSSRPMNSTLTNTGSSTSSSSSSLAVDDGFDFNERQQHLHQRHSLLLQVAELSAEKRVLQGQLEQARLQLLRVQKVGEERVDQLTRRLSDSQNEVVVATRHYNEHVKSLEDLLELERKRRQDDSDRVQAIILQLRRDMENSDIERLHAKEQATILEEKLLAAVTMNEQIPLLSEELTNVRLEVNTERVSREKLAKELEQVQEQYATACSEVQSLKETVAKLEKETASRAEEATKLRKDIKTCEKQKQDLQRQVRAIEARGVEERDEAYTKLEMLARKLEEIMVGSHSADSKTQTDMEAMRSAMLARLSEVEKQIEAASKQVAAVLSSVPDLQYVTVGLEKVMGVLPDTPQLSNYDSPEMAIKDCTRRLQTCLSIGGIRIQIS